MRSDKQAYCSNDQNLKDFKTLTLGGRVRTRSADPVSSVW